MTHEDFFKLMGFEKREPKESDSIWYERPRGALRGISIWPPRKDIWYLDFESFNVYTTGIKTSSELNEVQDLYKAMDNIRQIYKGLKDTNQLMPLEDEFKHSEKEEK